MVIEKNPDNRTACFTYDGTVFSQSCWNLDGVNANRTTEKIIHDLPAGSYILTLAVQRADGSTRVATTTVCSISAGLSLESCQGDIQ